MRRTLMCGIMGLLSGLAAAQPALVICGMNATDLSNDGNTILGSIYDANLNQNGIYEYVRGSGAIDMQGAWRDGSLRFSGDAQDVIAGMYNTTNWGGFGTSETIPWYYSPATGWYNIGTMPNGNKCDFNVNNANGISADGRWVCGGGWTNSTCGPFRAWVYDTVTAAYTTLPVSRAAPPAGTFARATRADYISADGSVVCGYDENYDPNLTAIYRRAAAWYKTGSTWTEVILDGWGGTARGVSGNGQTIIGNMSETQMNITFGTTVTGPIRWVRSGNTFTPILMGGGTDAPGAVNYDGSVIVGGYGNGFIWKSGYESPVDLAAYFTSLGGNLTNLSLGSMVGAPTAFRISNDGNTLLVYAIDSRSPCLTTGPCAIMYLNGAPCEPPRINFDPLDHIVTPPLSSLGPIENAFVAGSWPLTYQWQKKNGNGVWVNLADDNCGINNAFNFDVQGSTTVQLRLGYLSDVWRGYYRIKVTNSCGSAISPAVWISDGPPPCPGDLTGDHIIDLSDLALALSNYGLTGATPAQGDLTGDTVVDLADLAMLLSLYGTVCN